MQSHWHLQSVYQVISPHLIQYLYSVSQMFFSSSGAGVYGEVDYLDVHVHGANVLYLSMLPTFSLPAWLVAVLAIQIVLKHLTYLSVLGL